MQSHAARHPWDIHRVTAGVSARTGVYVPPTRALETGKAGHLILVTWNGNPARST